MRKSLKNLPNDFDISLYWAGTYPNRTRVSDVVHFHQTGTPKMPKRPFLILAGTHFKSFFRSEMFNMRTVEGAGRKMVYIVRSLIASIDSPKLSPTTIKRKKFTKPLIETTKMFNNTRFSVDKSKPSKGVSEMSELIEAIKKQPATTYVTSGKVTAIQSGAITLGDFSGVLSKGFRKLTHTIGDKNILLVLMQQQRIKIGTFDIPVSDSHAADLMEKLNFTRPS